MTAGGMIPGGAGQDWLRALRRYIAFLAAANLIWEVAQLPLYDVWLIGTARELAVAVLHCTGGDILIGLSTLMLSLFLLGSPDRPRQKARPVLLGAIVVGLGYTVFSEWLNVTIRQAWTYRDLMPVLPVTGTGLSPVLQWTLVPLAAYAWALRPMWARSNMPEDIHG